ISGKVTTGSMQQAETACPPATLGVQVCSSGEQNIEHFGTACVDDCGGVEWTDGFIVLSLEFGMAIKDLPNDIGVLAPVCLVQLFNLIVCSRLGHFHILLQLGPAHQAIP